MGADVSVFEEGELEQSFWKYHGPNDESITDLAKRTIRGNINQRKCTDYKIDEVLPPEYHRKFSLEEIRILSKGTAINCLYFTKLLPEGFPERMLNRDICVVYVHTNTRASIDAVELLPLCMELQCDLAAFDLPGCGKSGGIMAESMAYALYDFIQYVKYARKKQKIIVWARGMGTAVAVDFATSSAYCNEVDYMVLDSPFVSTERIISEIVDTVRKSGHYIPSSILDLSKYATKKAFSHYYKGVDPTKVNPYQQIVNCRVPMVPCHVFAATADDYVSAQQGYECAMAWTGPCNYQTYQGGHFGIRDPSLVTSVSSTLFEACRLPGSSSPSPGLVVVDSQDSFIGKVESLFDADDLTQGNPDITANLADDKNESDAAAASPGPKFRRFGAFSLLHSSPIAAADFSKLSKSHSGMRKSVSTDLIHELGSMSSPDASGNDIVDRGISASDTAQHNHNSMMQRSKSMMNFSMFHSK